MWRYKAEEHLTARGVRQFRPKGWRHVGCQTPVLRGQTEPSHRNREGLCVGYTYEKEVANALG
jgi:hypothetical protein